MASAEQRKSNGENKVKLADIAKQTGYSLATVSKALNGKADISEAARQASPERQRLHSPRLPLP